MITFTEFSRSLGKSFNYMLNFPNNLYRTIAQQEQRIQDLESQLRLRKSA